MGLSSITDKQKEAAWRVEFEALGEQLLFQNAKRVGIYNDEAKRQAALRWLSERDRTAQLAWLAFFAAIAAVLITCCCSEQSERASARVLTARGGMCARSCRAT